MMKGIRSKPKSSVTQQRFLLVLCSFRRLPGIFYCKFTRRLEYLITVRHNVMRPHITIVTLGVGDLPQPSRSQWRWEYMWKSLCLCVPPTTSLPGMNKRLGTAYHCPCGSTGSGSALMTVGVLNRLGGLSYR